MIVSEFSGKGARVPGRLESGGDDVVWVISDCGSIEGETNVRMQLLKVVVHVRRNRRW